jgi:hypothetical protein
MTGTRKKTKEIGFPRKRIASSHIQNVGNYTKNKTMKRFNTFTLIAFAIILTLFSCESNSQSFEGTIIYRTSVELPKNSDIPIEQFKMMFQDMDTIANFYLKNRNYKLVTLDANTNKPKSVTQYDSDSNMTYSYMAGQYDFCMAAKTKIDSLTKPKISTNNNDTITIMGHKCHSMTIDYGQISKTTIYFSEDFEVDTEPYKNNPVGFLEYIYRTGALPLKIVMSGNGAVHNMVFTAIEIKKETLKDTEFEIPEFKQIMDSPF